jgi:hypothetical protein
MVTVGLSGPAIAAIAASTVFGSRRIRTFSADPRTRQLAELAGPVASGAIVPVIDGVHPLVGIASAHRAFDAGGVLARQIVRVSTSEDPVDPA